MASIISILGFAGLAVAADTPANNYTKVEYFKDPMNCDCMNDKNNEVEFDNFWKTSGSCCDNLRLTIWIIFNIIFFILVFCLCLKIRQERQQIKRDLENFEQVNDVDDTDANDSSMGGSVQEGLVRNR